MRRLLVAAALVAISAAGCKRTLHWVAIEDGLASQLSAVAPVASVTCPETRVEAGLVFVCHMRFRDGGDTDVHVKLLDTAGSWRMTDILMPTADVAATLTKRLEKKAHEDVSVDCGKGLRASADGEFTCSAKGAKGDSALVHVTMQSNGDWRWRVE